jgi:serine phosphatase RsbU (regulator of sigma subunit)
MSVSYSQLKLVRTLEDLTARIRNEVQKAAEIQQALLPLPTFNFPGVRIAADLRTCSEIGGDFYDYFAINCDRLCLIIGDVSGHGVQSGMVTTAAKASLHTLIRQGIVTPASLLSEMNAAVFTTTRQALLMSCLVAIVCPSEHKIRYANAGHNFPYLCHRYDGIVEMLENPPCFPLGFDVHATFREQVIDFKPGDTFFLYSDGAIECSNGRTEFGYRQLERCLLELLNQSPTEWVRSIVDSLSAFRGNQGFEDDVTLLIARSEDDITMSAAASEDRPVRCICGDFA